MTTIARRNRVIGIEVSLYLRENEDPTCKWQNDCEHGSCVGHATKKLGLAFLAAPWEWCEECRALYDKKAAEGQTAAGKQRAP